MVQLVDMYRDFKSHAALTTVINLHLLYVKNITTYNCTEIPTILCSVYKKIKHYFTKISSRSLYIFLYYILLYKKRKKKLKS
jgi:hypothetical protein